MSVTAGGRTATTDGGPWKDLTLEPGQTRTLELGTLRLILKRAAGEVWLQSQRSPEPTDPEEGGWSRFAATPDCALSIRPAMPDRLLVVSPEHRYHLPPRQEARVYVRIPLFVQVVISRDRQEQILVDLPSIVLSDTWWGTFIEGELGYWLTTTARAAVTEDLFLTHVGMCPLRLVNDSATSLPVERFALQVPHLSLFSDGLENWTDEVRVRYEDSPGGSEITFGEEAPSEGRGAELLAPPRVRPGRGLHMLTFDRLRSLSTLGL